MSASLLRERYQLPLLFKVRLPSFGYAGCPLLFGILLGDILPQLLTMQGRTGKAPKKDIVIEGPQQYKSLAPAEAEVDAVPQVVVSHSRSRYFHLTLIFWVVLKNAALNRKDITVWSC